jgi:hypothetical protein
LATLCAADPMAVHALLIPDRAIAAVEVIERRH